MGLSRQKAFLEKVVEFQNQEIANNLAAVQEARDNIHAQLQKQESVLVQIELDEKKTKEIADMIKPLHEFTHSNYYKS